MWNYRVVRRKYVNPDRRGKSGRVRYTYAIHEAYYDDNGYVGAITETPVEPFGENIEELRHSWVMMAEAFAQPILDFDNIPEHGYERKEDPVASALDKRIRETETGAVEGISFEQIKKDLEEKFGPFDEEEYENQAEAERTEKEKIHSESFVGTASPDELIRKICSDYLEYIERDKTENPWKYNAENAEPDR